MEPNLTVARHAEMRDLLGAFALGAVDAQEAATVRAHLATCAECRTEIAQLWTAVDALPAAIEPMDPPPGLRERIAAAVRQEADVASPVTPVAPVMGAPEPIRRPMSWWSGVAPWAAAAALLLLLSVGMLLWNLRLQDQIGNTPVTQTVALAPTDAASGASGEVRYDPRGQLFLLDVRDLPSLAPGEVYEVWLIGPDGAPVPSGVFDQSTDRHAIVADRELYDTLAITAETGPLGAAAPTGEILATAAL